MAYQQARQVLATAGFAPLEKLIEQRTEAFRDLPAVLAAADAMARRVRLVELVLAGKLLVDLLEGQALPRPVVEFCHARVDVDVAAVRDELRRFCSTCHGAGHDA